MSKLTNDMSIEKGLCTFCEGNLGAAAAILAMADGDQDVYFCDSLDIRGEKVFKLLLHCCDGNIDKFNRTLTMFKCGIYSKDEIQTNLNLDTPIPFIDDAISIEGVPRYRDLKGHFFGPADEKWPEFCTKNKEAFSQKLSTQHGQQIGPKKR